LLTKESKFSSGLKFATSKDVRAIWFESTRTTGRVTEYRRNRPPGRRGPNGEYRWGRSRSSLTQRCQKG
jgi:hypothetical protein